MRGHAGVPVLAARNAVAAPRSAQRKREFLVYERIIAPLSDDGVAVNMLFGALDIVPKDAA